MYFKVSILINAVDSAGNEMTVPVPLAWSSPHDDLDDLDDLLGVLVSKDFLHEEAVEQALAAACAAMVQAWSADDLNDYLDSANLSWAEVTQTDPARVDPPSDSEIDAVRTLVTKRLLSYLNV